MDYKKIAIPEGIKYLGDLEGFELPNGIFNKSVTGCGATTVALKDQYPTILAAPRISLLENKAKQHAELFWVKASDITNNKLSPALIKYLDNIKIPKLLITYDSFHKLKNALGEEFNKYRVVVDEFHRLLKDSSFKSVEITNFIHAIEGCKYITLLSATPIPDKFIEKIDYLKSLDRYIAIWEDMETIALRSIYANNPNTVLYSIIDQYLINGYYPLKDDDDKLLFKSTEAIFFINSTKMICDAINIKKLKPDEVNILIADSDRNRKYLLKKLGSEYKIGKAPMKGEKNKMFTFCTSTAFDGVDFYSDNALQFAFSNASIECTLLDLAVDLQQIAGRQRLTSNPVYNSIIFVYSENKYSFLTEDSISSYIKNRTKQNIRFLDGLNGLDDKLKRAFQKEILSKDYLDDSESLAVYLDKYDNTFKLNEFKLIAEEDALDLIRNYMYNGIPTLSR